MTSVEHYFSKNVGVCILIFFIPWIGKHFKLEILQIWKNHSPHCPGNLCSMWNSWSSTLLVIFPLRFLYQIHFLSFFTPVHLFLTTSQPSLIVLPSYLLPKHKKSPKSLFPVTPMTHLWVLSACFPWTELHYVLFFEKHFHSAHVSDSSKTACIKLKSGPSLSLYITANSRLY